MPSEILEPRDIGFRNLLVNFLCEQERYVDIDAFTDQLPNCRKTFGSAGHLDHDVLAIRCLPQSSRFIHGVLRLAGKVRGNFEADITVVKLRLLVDRAEDVGSILNVANRELLETPGGIEILARGKRLQHVIVQRAVRNGFLEDRGIRGHSPQSVLGDHVLQLAAGKQIATDVVKPHRLAVMQ